MYIFGSGAFGAPPPPVEEPTLTECSLAEAVKVLVDTRSESMQGQLAKMERTGYVIARRKT